MKNKGCLALIIIFAVFIIGLFAVNHYINAKNEQELEITNSSVSEKENIQVAQEETLPPHITLKNDYFKRSVEYLKIFDAMTGSSIRTAHYSLLVQNVVVLEDPIYKTKSGNEKSANELFSSIKTYNDGMTFYMNQLKSTILSSDNYSDEEKNEKIIEIDSDIKGLQEIFRTISAFFENVENEYLSKNEIETLVDYEKTLFSFEEKYYIEYTNGNLIMPAKNDSNNPLLNRFKFETVYDLYGEQVGTRYYLNVNKSDVQDNIESNLEELAKNWSAFYSDSNWCSIIFDDGTGICFTGGSPLIGEYGTVDELGRIEKGYGHYVRQADLSYIYTEYDD